MRPRAKKIIAISSGSILAAALCVWYFFPVLKANLVWYRNSVIRHYLNSAPSPITALKEPPDEWKDIAVGDLTMKLPMAEYTKVGGKETYVYFMSNTGVLLVSDIVPSEEMLRMIKEKKLKYPLISYREELAIFSSTPTDISFFNSRNKNATALRNQTLKAVAMPKGGLSKVLTVNAGTLKALCILSEKNDKGCQAIAHVYSQNEEASVSLIFNYYKDKTTLEADLLAVLGGIKMPAHPGDPDQVSRDINSIVTQFNKM